ncbi:MAG: PilZ domain-containing protein [Lachnospiraceae bacterium]|nr:PilZ domain-containing protein [Lachnospiraceae bacterium]
MLIGNLDHDTKVTIYVTDGIKAVQLTSQVLYLSKTDYLVCMEKAKNLDYQSFIGIKVIKAGERIVNFSSENITCTITALKNYKPYSWDNVKIVRLTLPEQGTIHMVLSNDDRKTFNRRNEYRLFLGEEGICRFGDSNAPKNVMIKDVSCSGVGIMINKSDDIEIKAGMKIEVEFSQTRKDGNRQTFMLTGKIVRYIAMNNNMEMIGCKLSGRNQELVKMIYEKQRQNMTTDYKLQVKKESTKSLVKGFEALYGQNPEEEP